MHQHMIMPFNFKVYFYSHIKKSDKPNVENINRTVRHFDLIQHVINPIHMFGNTLDLIITKNNTE